mmetsp:Transcript_20792/g.57729  ORF Transcript_20792/g.57729 Transcript_20792/m.57729 type:complete len:90 (+) Transcript_20792:1010-1279(+)
MRSYCTLWLPVTHREQPMAKGPSSWTYTFGDGEDLSAIQAQAQKLGCSLDFRGALDHLDRRLTGYQVFVNPSTSDVLATTTAEALAMGK